MKRVLFVTIMATMVIAMATGSYAAPADSTATTTAGVTVDSIFSVTLGAPATYGSRSQGSLTFKTVDGTAPAGWYYNNLAALDAVSGNPNDNKCDVAVIAKSNASVPYYLKIKKSGDTLDGKIGYGIGGAYDSGQATTTPADGTVTYPSGWKGTTGTGNLGWGELPTTSTTMYTSGTAIYATYGVLVPVSFALVPEGLATSATPYTTTITYTLTTTP